MTLAVSIAQSGANNVTMRNRIINGAMMIDQRNAGAAVTSNNSGQYPVDRFIVEAYGGGVLTSQQSSTAPAGFKNSILLTVTTTDTSLGTTDDYEFSQKIEGFNTADFGWGTANAQPVTLSFWVRSSVATTYSIGFQNSDASRSYVGTYTINSANTWEQKTITVAGDTSGTWNTSNSTGLFLRWCLATGTNRVAAAANTWEGANRIAISATANPIMGTSGATFYITGVQLEEGTTATAFEQRLYGTELALCQRYCQAYRASNAYDVVASLICIGYTTSLGGGAFQFKQEMRAAPTMTKGGNWRVCNYAAGFPITNWVIDSARTSNSACEWNFVGASGLTAGAAYYLQTNNDTTAYFVLSAEL